MPSNGRIRHELHQDLDELPHTPGDDGESAQEFAHHAISKYLHSNFIDSEWQGITDDILPYFHPSKILIQLKPLRYQVSLSLEKINHLNGVENFSDCIKSLVQFSDCIEQCVPFYLYHTVNYSLCYNHQSYVCNRDSLYFNSSNVDQTYQCHKPKIHHLYNPRSDAWIQAQNSTVLYFYFESTFVLHQEEIYQVTLASFLGSIGGSLSLFVGFSLYTYFSECANLIFKHMFEI